MSKIENPFLSVFSQSESVLSACHIQFSFDYHCRASCGGSSFLWITRLWGATMSKIKNPFLSVFSQSESVSPACHIQFSFDYHCRASCGGSSFLWMTRLWVAAMNKIKNPFLSVFSQSESVSSACHIQFSFDYHFRASCEGSSFLWMTRLWVAAMSKIKNPFLSVFCKANPCHPRAILSSVLIIILALLVEVPHFYG